MIRKHFRIRRIVLGLAFAAFVVAPSAQAMTGLMEDGGPGMSSRSSVKVAPEIQSGIQAHVPIASEMSVQADQLTPLEVEGLRWQAVADSYASQKPVRSENSFGVPGPSAGGAQGPVAVQTVKTVGSDRFDWSDAGIGGSIAFGIALMLLTAVVLGRRHNRSLASV